ncbi:MAG: hypothetical protein IPN20_04860 [Haliscomenobacter sp.]|nr:hypothetical protein [Haliscomenobacter sp.]
MIPKTSLTACLLVLSFTVGGRSNGDEYKDPVYHESEILIVEKLPFATIPRNLVYRGPLYWAGKHLPFLEELSNKASTRVLKATVYSPPRTRYMRPAVFVLPSAIFPGFNQKENQDLMCMDFARRGYVAIAVPYPVAPYGPKLLSETVYRGVQVQRAAMRYFTNHPERFAIHPDYFLVAGIGIGAIVANHTALWDEPSEIGANYRGLEKKYGALDGIGESGSFAKPLGILSLGGGIFKIGLVDDNTPPMLLIHGDQDPIVPPSKGFLAEQWLNNLPPKYRVKSTKGRTYYRPPFSKNPLGKPVLGQPYVFGPREIEQALISFQIRHQVRILEGHGANLLTSESGIRRDAADTIFQRTADFFHAIMQDTARFQGESIITDHSKLTYSALTKAKKHEWHVRGGKIVQDSGSSVTVQWDKRAKTRSISLFTYDEIGLKSYPAYLEVHVAPKKNNRHFWPFILVPSLSLLAGWVYFVNGQKQRSGRLG